MTKTAAVYRLYGEGDDLLYVGYSGSVFGRLSGHQYSTPWMQDVRRIDLEWHSTRDEAYRAEQRAILAESPRHNERECVVPLDDHDEIIERLEADPFLTYTAVAEEYGVSRERVRQIAPDDLASRRKQARDESRLNEKLIKRMQRTLARNLHCRVCDAWILRKSQYTCSPECAEAWTILRSVDDPDEHRRHMARTYLASPAKYSEATIEWARQMLGPNPPERNRTFLVPGSKRAEIIRKYRPAVYEELVAS